MFNIGKTTTSNESPDFFHLPNVPTLSHQVLESHRQLRPILKLNSSLENPLNNSSSLKSLQTNKALPKNKEFSLKSSVFMQDTSMKPSQFSEAMQDKRPVFKNNIDYYSKYHSVLQSTGFGITSNLTNKQFSTPRIIRNESEKLHVLKNKLAQKTFRGHFEKTKEKGPTVTFMFEAEQERKRKIRDTQIGILNKDIEDFEQRLKKINSSPKLKRSQKDIYQIDFTKIVDEQDT